MINYVYIRKSPNIFTQCLPKTQHKILHVFVKYSKQTNLTGSVSVHKHFQQDPTIPYRIVMGFMKNVKLGLGFVRGRLGLDANKKRE